VFLKTNGYRRGSRDILKPQKFRKVSGLKPFLDKLERLVDSRELEDPDLIRTAYSFTYKGTPFRQLPKEAKRAILDNRYYFTEIHGVPVVLYMTRRGGLVEINHSTDLEAGMMVLTDKVITGHSWPVVFTQRPNGSWTTETIFRIRDSARELGTRKKGEADFDDDD